MDIRGIGKAVRRSILCPGLEGTSGEAGLATAARSILDASDAGRQRFGRREVHRRADRACTGLAPVIGVVGTSCGRVGGAATAAGDGVVGDLGSCTYTSGAWKISKEIVLHLAFSP
jgi:hypothetical protein